MRTMKRFGLVASLVGVVVLGATAVSYAADMQKLAPPEDSPSPAASGAVSTQYSWFGEPDYYYVARTDIRVTGLSPRTLYSLWGYYFDDSYGGMFPAKITTFTTDSRGRYRGAGFVSVTDGAYDWHNVFLGDVNFPTSTSVIVLTTVHH